MGEREPLEQIAERYRKDGFDVLIRPSTSDLPAFLANTPVDLVARKGDHVIALKANQGGDSDEEPVEVDADLGIDAAIEQIAEAEHLLNPRTMRAALVMAWAAFEASTRAVLQPGKSAFAGGSPRQLVEELGSRGIVAEEEHGKLQQAFYLRNAIVHGVRPEEVPPELVPFLLGTARRLLQMASPTSRIGIRDSVTVTVLRKGVNEVPRLKARAERATQVLLELLGPSRNSVSIDWDIAEDGRGYPVVILRISDANGTVSATFEPRELEDEDHLRVRLNRLWGDLLEIRSHKQVQRLMGLKSRPGPGVPAA